MSIDKIDVKNVSIWVIFPKLPFTYSGEENVFKIACIMGNVVKMDQVMKDKDQLSFARVMIEAGMQHKLSSVVEFCNEHL